MGSACLGVGTHYVDNPQPLEENSSDALSCSALHRVNAPSTFPVPHYMAMDSLLDRGGSDESFNHVLWLGLGMSCGVSLADPR